MPACLPCILTFFSPIPFPSFGHIDIEPALSRQPGIHMDPCATGHSGCVDALGAGTLICLFSSAASCCRLHADPHETVRVARRPWRRAGVADRRTVSLLPVADASVSCQRLPPLGVDAVVPSHLLAPDAERGGCAQQQHSVGSGRSCAWSIAVHSAAHIMVAAVCTGWDCCSLVRCSSDLRIAASHLACTARYFELQVASHCGR